MRTVPILSPQSSELPQTSIKRRPPYQLEVFPSRPDSLTDFKINTARERMSSLAVESTSSSRRSPVSGSFSHCGFEFSGKRNIDFMSTSVEQCFGFMKTKLSRGLENQTGNRFQGVAPCKSFLPKLQRKKLPGCYSGHTSVRAGKLRYPAGNGTSNIFVQPEHFPPRLNMNA